MLVNRLGEYILLYVTHTFLPIANLTDSNQYSYTVNCVYVNAMSLSVITAFAYCF